MRQVRVGIGRALDRLAGLALLRRIVVSREPQPPTPEAEARDRQLTRAAVVVTLLVVLQGVGLQALFGSVTEAWNFASDQARTAPPSGLRLFLFLLVFAFSAVTFVPCLAEAAESTRAYVSGSTADVRPHGEERKHNAVVVALSLMNEDPFEELRRLVDDLAREFQKDSAARVAEFCEPSDHERRKSLRQLNWQQAIRAIDHHVRWEDGAPRLPEVWVMTSRESDGQFPDFRDHVAKLYGFRPATLAGLVRKVEPPVDFESYEEVYKRLAGLVGDLDARLGDGETVIDITGGQKPFSIAGAVVSLGHPDRKFSYVPEGGRPKFYNAQLDVRIPGRVG
jgi:hypothetical protein